jgi:single-stranded-DNA-specific exonuclease
MVGASSVTAALSQKMLQGAGLPALLGVERSARGLRWVERLDPSRAATALAIAQANGLPELLGRLLAARGAEAGTLPHYLDPSLRHLMPDPSNLQDMERAATRFARAIRTSEPIAVFGDYDVDGAASVALIERFLRAHGQSVTTYIPDRLTEGYGPTPEALAGLAADGARLILTVDCGTTAGAAIEAAVGSGADIIVIDHHQADEALPAAFAVVNPNRQDDLSGQGHLAAAGVVFLFLVAAVRALRREGGYRNRPEPDLLGLLDLVALATVCDVVPLKGVNRALVAKGLKMLRLRHNPGLRALADAACIDMAPTCYTLGFILGPRINAGGRVGASGLGARLLASDDEIETRAIAGKLEALNAERKAIEERMLEEAFALAEQQLETGRPFIWLGVDGWHKGLLGLVAGRVAERFNLPSFAVGWDPDGQGVGSARSIGAVDLGHLVRAAVHEGLFTRGGGHAMAAGFKLEGRRQDQLLGFLAERLATPVAAATAFRPLAIDGALAAGAANKELIELLERAGPYGQGHPEPRFAFPAHRLARLRPINDKHLRVTLIAADGSRLEACAFRAIGTPLGDLMLKSDGLPLHVAGHLRRDTWNGRDGVELIIEDAAAIGARSL